MTGPKPKVAFYWCAGCGGCEEAVLDLDEQLLGVAAAVDIVFWPVALDFKRADLERLPDGSVTAALVNGGIRTGEHAEMARLLRRKAQVLIAFGACAQAGGVPALANLATREQILDCVYREAPSVVNAERTLPAPEWHDGGEVLELPVLEPALRPLGEVVAVDYYLPGCPPPPTLLMGALEAMLSGHLPERGSVLAPDRALCDTCPRRDSKPADLALAGFKRPHQLLADAERCLLAQGLLCLGPATRGGCEARCVGANMPCTGCMGPTSRVKDAGGKAVAMFGSLLDARDDQAAAVQAATVVDPVGTFYRYSLAGALLHAARPSPGAARR